MGISPQEWASAAGVLITSVCGWITANRAKTMNTHAAQDSVERKEIIGKIDTLTGMVGNVEVGLRNHITWHLEGTDHHG